MLLLGRLHLELIECVHRLLIEYRERLLIECCLLLLLIKLVCIHAHICKYVQRLLLLLLLLRWLNWIYETKTHLLLLGYWYWRVNIQIWEQRWWSLLRSWWCKEKVIGGSWCLCLWDYLRSRNSRRPIKNIKEIIRRYFVLIRTCLSRLRLFHQI